MLKYYKNNLVLQSVSNGFSRSFPIFLGYIPVGIAFGVLALNIGLSPFLTLFMSGFMIGASAQLIAIQLIAIGTDAWVIVVTTFIINLRHMLMASYIAPELKHWNRSEIYLFSFGLTDEAFALHSSSISDDKFEKIEAITINMLGYLAWFLGTILGVFAEAILSKFNFISLDYSLTAMFIALIILLTDTVKKLIICLTAGFGAVVLALFNTSHWNALIVAIIAATLGLVIDKWKINH